MIRASYNGWNVEYDQVSGAIKRIGEFFFDDVVTFYAGGYSPNNLRNQMFDVVGEKPIPGETKLVSAEGELTLTVDIGDFTRITRLTFEKERVAISVTLKANACARIRYALWETGYVKAHDYAAWEVLAPTYTPQMLEPYDLHKTIADYQLDELIAPCHEGGGTPAYRSGIIGAYNPSKQRALLSWWIGENFTCHNHLTRCNALKRISKIYCPCDMRAGDQLSLGTIFLGAFDGSRLDAVHGAAASFAPWSREIDPVISDLRICEICIGDKAGRKVFDTYDQVIAQLPKIKQLGFNTLEIMPAMPFPSYSVFDMMDLNTTYRDENGLKELIQLAHAQGFKVIADIVLHGPLDYDPAVVNLPRSPYLDNHPDWFMRHESGIYARTYTRSLDLSNPSYQAHIGDVMLNLIDKLNVDGFRLDAQMWCEYPSWDDTTGRLPHECLTAGLRMMADISTRVRTIKPDIIFYTEANGPLTTRDHGCRYNYDMHWLWAGLMPSVDPRGIPTTISSIISNGTLSWPDAVMWLNEQRAALPMGTVIIHQVDSHDSHEWLGAPGGQFNREAYGVDAHRALMALAAFMNGGFMSYYDAWQGNEDIYAQVLNGGFKHGTCKYIALDHPKVAMIAWDDAKLVANLTDQDLTVTLPGGTHLTLKSRAVAIVGTNS